LEKGKTFDASRIPGRPDFPPSIFSTLNMSSLFVVPGQRIATTGTPGTGVYLSPTTGQLHASLVGTASLDPHTGIISVMPHPVNACRSVVPAVDQLVVGVVSKLTAKYAAVDIRAIIQDGVGKKQMILPEPFRGTIRMQDIWLEEDYRTATAALASGTPASSVATPLLLSSCFAPGDIVRCKVLGVGDAQAGFLLSTGAAPSLGVVFARGSQGEPLVPVAFNSMLCPTTGRKEPRKCARPDAK